MTMAKSTRLTTENIYFSYSIGLLLLIQITQIYSSKLPAFHDSAIKSSNRQFNYAETTSKEEENFNSKAIHQEDDNKENVATKLLDLAVRVDKQVKNDKEINHDEAQWKLFPLNNKKNLSTRQYYNEFEYNYNSPSRETYVESRIVFPDEDTSYKSYKSNIPTCTDSVICENVPNYPIATIEKQLAEKEYLKHLQTQDEIVEVINRIGNSDDDPLCVAKEDIMYPRAALTRHNGFMFVVNADNFVQAVRVEICKNEDSPCRLIDEFASGYKTMCEQKYIYRQLLGIHKNGTLGTEYFQIPSSCCCHVKFVGNTWERMDRVYRDHAQN